MNGLPDNLHTRQGAEEFLQIVFSSAKEKFDLRGAVGSSSFLFLTVNPKTGDEFPDGPAVSVLDGSDSSILEHEAKVRLYAERYRAVGVLTIFEAWACSTEDEIIESDELGQLLADCRDGVEEDEVFAGIERRVVVEFEHLRFNPSTRVWYAPVFDMGDDGLSLGVFEETEDPTPAFDGFLEFFN